MAYRFAEWDKEDQYPNRKDHPLCFSWEFLRRNETYQADYDANVRPHSSLAGELVSEAVRSCRSFLIDVVTSIYGAPIGDAGTDDALNHVFCLFPGTPEIPIFATIVERGGERSRITASRDFSFARQKKLPWQPMCRRWHITGLPPAPENDRVLGQTDESIFFYYAFDGMKLREDTRKSESPSIRRPANFLNLEFDVLLPIEPQLKRAAAQLKGRLGALVKGGEAEPVRFRNRLERYPNYLRMLDAKAAGATPGDMARVFFPGIEAQYGTKRCANGLKAAETMRDRDWRLIFLSEQEEPRMNPE